MFGKKNPIQYYGKMFGGSESYSRGSVMPIHDACKFVASELNLDEKDLENVMSGPMSLHIQNGWILGIGLALEMKTHEIVSAFLGTRPARGEGAGAGRLTRQRAVGRQRGQPRHDEEALAFRGRGEGGAGAAAAGQASPGAKPSGAGRAGGRTAALIDEFPTRVGE